MKNFKLASCTVGILLLMCVNNAVAVQNLLQTGACFNQDKKVIFSWILYYDDVKRSNILLTSNSETPDIKDINNTDIFKPTATNKIDSSKTKLISARFAGTIDGNNGPWFFDIIYPDTVGKPEQDWKLTKQGSDSVSQPVICHVNNYSDVPTALVGTQEELAKMSITWFLPITNAGKQLSFPMWIAYSSGIQLGEEDIPVASDNFKKEIKTFFGGETKLVIITKLTNGSRVPTEVLGENKYGKWSIIRQMSEEKRLFWIINGKFLNTKTGKLEELKDVLTQSRSNNFNFKFHQSFDERKLYPLLTEMGICGMAQNTLDREKDPYFVLRWERYADNKILWSNSNAPEAVLVDNKPKVEIENNKLTAMLITIEKDKKTQSQWKMSLVEELPYKVQKWSLSRYNQGIEKLPDKETIYCNIID